MTIRIDLFNTLHFRDWNLRRSFLLNLKYHILKKGNYTHLDAYASWWSNDSWVIRNFLRHDDNLRYNTEDIINSRLLSRALRKFQTDFRSGNFQKETVWIRRYHSSQKLFQRLDLCCTLYTVQSHLLPPPFCFPPGPATSVRKQNRGKQ